MCQNGDSWKSGVSKMVDQEASFSSSSNINKKDNNSKKQPGTVGTNFVGVVAHNQRFTAVKQMFSQEKAIFKMLRKFCNVSSLHSFTPSKHRAVLILSNASLVTCYSP